MAMQPLTRVILLIEEFRKIDPEMAIHSALILLLVARQPGINLKDLAKETGLGKSAISRNVATLSKEHGKGLITYSESLTDRRNKEIKLTHEGERFLRSILHYVGDKEAA